MTDVEAATAAHLAAVAALKDYEAKTYELVKAIEAERRAGKSALQSAEWEAKKALVAARDAEISDHEWEGKKVKRTARKQRYPGSTLWNPEMVEYTDYGFIETVRSTTKFPENTANYRKPRVGEIIVREVKRDGTPSLKFKEFEEKHQWSLA